MKNETPNPTLEEYLDIAEAISEQQRNLTPEQCPYFHGFISELWEQDGVKVGWINSLEIVANHVIPGSSPVPLPRERPDQITVLPMPGMEIYRFTIAQTHLFVTDDGSLCCLTPKESAGKKRGARKAGEKEIIVLLEQIPPDPEILGSINERTRPYSVIRDAVRKRNIAWNITPPDELTEVICKKWQSRLQRPLGEHSATIDAANPVVAQAIAIASEYPIHTSQEMSTVSQAQSNGKTFKGYIVNEQAGAIIFERKGASHQVRLLLTEEERSDRLPISALENLVRFQDADAPFATNYILRLLAPPPHLAFNGYAGGWIDFDDVIEKIGWDPRTTKERREMHARIWEYIRFGARAHVVGKRSGLPYTDKEGNIIDTTLDGPLWQIMTAERPRKKPQREKQQLVLCESLETPVRAEIVISKELSALLTHPKAAQYLEGGDILISIPSGQPSGSWARVIGLALMEYWRRNPQEVMNGTRRPTRRELLDKYTAKVAPYESVLSSKNSTRAIEYWCSALQALVDANFIERSGEVLNNAEEMRSSLPLRNWQEQWLNQEVIIIPSKQHMHPQVKERAGALPEKKPRDLTKKRRSTKKRDAKL